MFNEKTVNREDIVMTATNELSCYISTPVGNGIDLRRVASCCVEAAN